MTTLQDLGSRGRVVLDLRDAVNAGLICGPRILASGPPITISGGHMHYLGGEADTADEVRRIARSHWRMGADVFKMVLNGGGTPRTHPWIPAYSQPEIDAAVAEARDHETQLIVHANSSEAIRRGVMAGVSAVEHCTFLRGPGDVLFDARLAEEIVHRGVYVEHTLQAGYRSLQRAREQWSELSLSERVQWDARQRVLDAQMNNCAQLLNMGALVVASTDAGWSLNRFGEYWIGMELLVRAGATPLEALTTGTRIAAKAVGLADKLGTLGQGKSPISPLLVAAARPIISLPESSVSLLMRWQNWWEPCIVTMPGRTGRHYALLAMNFGTLRTARGHSVKSPKPSALNLGSRSIRSTSSRWPEAFRRPEYSRSDR